MKRIIAALLLALPSLVFAQPAPSDGGRIDADPPAPLAQVFSSVRAEMRCPPGQHIGPRDKDSSYRECVPDRPKRPVLKPPRKPVIHTPACPPVCQPCDLSDMGVILENLHELLERECPDCICNPAPSVTLPYIGEPYEAEVEYHEPYSSLPPPGHFVTGLGVFRLPSTRTIVSWDVVVEEREVDPRLTIRESARWMPFASAGWEFSGGTRLIAHVGYVLGGEARLSATDLHYGSYRRVRNLDVRGDSGGVALGLSLEKVWK